MALNTEEWDNKVNMDPGLIFDLVWMFTENLLCSDVTVPGTIKIYMKLVIMIILNTLQGGGIFIVGFLIRRAVTQ